MEANVAWVAEVRHAPKLHYLLVVLKDTVTPDQLTSLSVDGTALLAAYTGDAVTGICVTLRGRHA